MNDRVAIIGGGFSGAMLAARLAESGADVALIERGDRAGLGVAYSTPFASHLLNVRSGRMSARADQPRDFVDWLEETHPELADPEGFAPRRVYGEYVRSRLATAQAKHADRLQIVRGEAKGLDDGEVILADGSRLAARAVVLATGNPPPRTARPGQDPNLIIADPWAPGALDVVRPSDEVVIVGSGLTMIDVMLMLEDRGWLGRALVISRRGLMPRPHDANQPRVEPRAVAPGPLSTRLATERRHVRAEGWGVTMDRLRSLNARLWGELTGAERSRFLRHLRPWWDVHRHRIAPEPARRIEALMAEDRLVVRAGRLETVEARRGGLEVRWRPRGHTASQTRPTDRLIDCTGPGHDPTRSAEPFTRALIAQGLARPDPLRLGLDVDAEGRLIDARGRASDRIFVLGPPALAAFWETVAVPDIRERIEDLTARLTPG
ncbi:FAD/NAD(P)-binding protein [Brevundimonas lutea]|uniref:FAD/NAD(P)-binding protein n=1 Tax=Brevundimonas lutea TaxID=2293980 RepID=UPI001F0C161F|nr:FAD-dependent oxidoreductase [Brevundimonas lutea]